MVCQQLLMVPFHSSLWCLKVFVNLLKENPVSCVRMGHTIDIFHVRNY